MSDETSSAALPRAAFPTTRWSVVLAAKQREQPESVQALETLCRSYWYPLYVFVRSSGWAPADAEDLTQEFFARLLEKNYLRVVEPQKGRFRTFLRFALKRFLAKEWERIGAANVAVDRDRFLSMWHCPRSDSPPNVPARFRPSSSMTGSGPCLCSMMP